MTIYYKMFTLLQIIFAYSYKLRRSQEAYFQWSNIDMNIMWVTVFSRQTIPMPFVLKFWPRKLREKHINSQILTTREQSIFVVVYDRFWWIIFFWLHIFLVIPSGIFANIRTGWSTGSGEIEITLRTWSTRSLSNHDENNKKKPWTICKLLGIYHTSIYGMCGWGWCPGKSCTCIVISYWLDHARQNARHHAQHARYAECGTAPLTWRFHEMWYQSLSCWINPSLRSYLGIRFAFNNGRSGCDFKNAICNLFLNFTNMGPHMFLW